MAERINYDNVNPMIVKYVNWMKEHDNFEPRLEIPESDELSEEDKNEEIRLAYWWSTNPEEKNILEKYKNNKYIYNIPKEYRSAMTLCRTVGLFLPEKKDKFNEFIAWVEEHDGRIPHSCIYDYPADENGKKHKRIKNRDELTEEELKEVRLGTWWYLTSKERNLALKYAYEDLENIHDENERNIVDICRRHGLGAPRRKKYNFTLDDYVAWLDEHNNQPPRDRIEGDMSPKVLEEMELAKWWKLGNIKNKLNKYYGIKLEDIEDEIIKEQVRLFRERGLEKVLYGPIDCDFDRYLAWIDENKRRPKSVYNSNLKSRYFKQHSLEERIEVIYSKWWNVQSEERKIFEQYRFTKMEDIPDEYKEIVKKCREYCLETLSRNYTLQDYLRWIEQHNGEKPTKELYSEDGIMKVKREKYMSDEEAKRARTEEEEEKFQIAAWWSKTKEFKLLNKYYGMDLRDIPAEDREKVDELRKLGLGRPDAFKNIHGFLRWVKEHGMRHPRNTISDGNRGYKSHIGEGEAALSEEETEERMWGNWWQAKPIERDIIEHYVGVPLSKVPEQHRELIKEARDAGVGIILRKRDVPTLEDLIKWRNENDEAWPRAGIKMGDGRNKVKYQATNENEVFTQKENEETFVGRFISHTLSVNRNTLFEEFDTIPAKEQDVIIYSIKEGRPIRKSNKLVAALKNHPEFIENYQYQTLREEQGELTLQDTEEKIPTKDQKAMQLENIIQELKQAYITLGQRDKELQVAIQERVEELERVRNEKITTEEKLHKLEKIVEDNRQFFEELGELESFEEKIQNTINELEGKRQEEKGIEETIEDLRKQQSEVQNQKEDIKKQIHDISQEL